MKWQQLLTLCIHQPLCWWGEGAEAADAGAGGLAGQAPAGVDGQAPPRVAGMALARVADAGSILQQGSPMQAPFSSTGGRRGTSEGAAVVAGQATSGGRRGCWWGGGAGAPTGGLAGQALAN